MGNVDHDYAGRLERAGRACAEAGLDGLVITPSADLAYLIGYDAMLLERLTALVVRPAGEPVLVVPELERPRAASSPAAGLVPIEGWPDGGDAYAVVRGVLGAAGRVAIGDRMFAAHVLNLQSALPHASFGSASAIMSGLRIRKDRSEIELLARAGASADRSFAQVTGQGLSGKRERQVARALAEALVTTGHDDALFTIVGAGPNGASPHHDSGDRRIEPGDPVVMDFGGRVGGYCSDITRTVSVGEPPDEVKEVHDIVRQVQEAAFLAIAPGIPAQEVDRAARRVVEAAGHGRAFIHRTGHGIGLDEHEDPYIVEGNEQPLGPGMCFSIEPGIYLEGRYGVRIEDIVTVTEDGARRLNEAPRDLTVVS